jgi:hypothetical protein
VIQTFVEAYPWDLMPVDAEPLLARLRGEAGVTGLSVWAAAGARRTLRVRDCRPRVFRSRGGLYFQPRRDRYEHGRCRPLVSTWTHEGERFARVTAACERNGLKLRLLVSAAATGRLAEHYPEFASCNVLGVESTRNLCLVNPDVQEYLIALVSDLTEQFSPAAVVLTDYALGWFEAFDACLEDGLLTPAARSLLGLCFCQSCQQQAEEAGVDALAASERVLAVLQSSLADGKAPPSLDAVGAASPPLAEYRRFQHERLNGLLRSLIEACSAELLLARDLRCPHTDATAFAGVSLSAGLVTRLADQGDLDGGFVGKAKRNELSLPLALGGGDRGPQLVSTVHRAVEMGYQGLQIEHFGVLADPALPVIKQAVRFARRSSD